MTERLKTLILDANGAGWKNVLADTLLRGVLKLKCDEDDLPARWKNFRRAQWLLGRRRYEAQSYIIDWLDAFILSPRLDVEVCNMNNLIDYRRARSAIESYPLIILLHSAVGDDLSLPLRTAHWFEKRRGKLVVFIGNEYDLMEEKKTFLRQSGADYIASQLPTQSAQWVYADCAPSQVLPMPHALNPAIYHPDSRIPRNYDIGFVGAVYPYFLGDCERNDMVRYFQEHCPKLNLTCEIRNGTPHKMLRANWAYFLNTCRGIIGAEAGTYYLDRQGTILSQAKAYQRKNPQASFAEIYQHFFAKPSCEYVSGKSISSRHFEPMGTKTCQILLEGNYNGILKPDEHYISLKKDYSNLEDVLQRFRDEAYRQAMVERAYQYAMDEHTYQRRVEQLIDTVFS